MYIGIRQKKWKKLVYKLKPEFIRLNETNRLYKLKTPVIGLTGGVATGKSTVTKMLREFGMPVIEADKLVHKIYAQDSSLEFIKTNFPAAIKKDKIDFPALRKLFFESGDNQKKIEKFIYAQLETEFLLAADKFKGMDFLIYDVPLLFEKKLNTLVDTSVCVYAGLEIQITRMMERDNIEKELALKMIQTQIDIDDKRDMSDWIIENGGPLKNLDSELNKFIEHLFRK